jgi:integrase
MHNGVHRGAHGDVVGSYTEVHARHRPDEDLRAPHVKLPRFLADLLGEHQAVTGPTGLVFRDSRSGPLRHSNFYRRTFEASVERAAKAGSIPKALRFHDLRHTCVALLIAQGAHPMAIKEPLGQIL